MAHALPNRFRRGPQAYDQRVLLETRQIVRLRRQTTAAGDHRTPGAREFGDDLLLDLAKPCFPGLFENFRNLPSRSFFDQFIRVNEFEMQARRDHAAHRRLAGAHKTDESDVFNVPLGHAAKIRDTIALSKRRIIWNAGVLACSNSENGALLCE